jgi:hypothetical protein
VIGHDGEYSRDKLQQSMNAETVEMAMAYKNTTGNKQASVTTSTSTTPAAGVLNANANGSLEV